MEQVTEGLSPTPGSLLAQARAAKGLSLDDLAQATRLRASALEDAEADDFRGLGGDPYTTGHLRTMCRLLDLDESEVIEAYSRMRS